MTKLLRARMFFVLCIISTAIRSPANPLYYVTDLDASIGANIGSDAFGINSFGQVVGNFGGFAFLWTPNSRNSPQGTFVYLDTTQNSYAFGINSFGQVVGGGYQAFLWTPIISNSSDGTVISLGSLRGEMGSSAAFGINDSGQVVGRSVATRGEHGFLWSPSTPNGTTGTMIDLGDFPNGRSSSWARGINALGLVTGDALVTPKRVDVFLWKPLVPNGTVGDLIDISSQSGNDAAWNGVAINSIGQIVGRAVEDHAFLWTPIAPNETAGSLLDLGVLPGGSTTSYAYAINSYGWVVGRGSAATGSEAAFLWKPDIPNGTTGTMIDLNSVLEQSTRGGWVFQSARGINDAGQIVGYGRINGTGVTHALLLTPIPEPAALALVAMLSMAGLLIARRRIA